MADLTENSLGIFWEGEEKDGILVYALFRGDRKECPEFPADAWPKKCKHKPYKLFGEGWTVWMWDILIAEWPRLSDWLNTIRRTLEGLARQDALLSWAGMEGLFLDPPGLFDPERMGVGIWAVCYPSGQFYCRALLGETFQTIDKSLAKQIWVDFRWLNDAVRNSRE